MGGRSRLRSGILQLRLLLLYKEDICTLCDSSYEEVRDAAEELHEVVESMEAGA